MTTDLSQKSTTMVQRPFYLKKTLSPASTKERSPLNELTLGNRRHFFIEKALLREHKLLQKHRAFYKDLALLKEKLPRTTLHLGQELISIRAKQEWRKEAENKDFMEEAHVEPAHQPLKQLLRKLIHALSPWRKGPYELLGEMMASEWKSQLKWQRLAKTLLPLCTGKRIIDIGANNGYFMYRLLETRAAWVLGLEPTQRYVLQYDLLRACLFTSEETELLGHHLTLLGYEALSELSACADVVLLLGILYHHPHPLAILQQVHRTLVRRGKVIIDCAGLAAETLNEISATSQPNAAYSAEIALFPRKTYTGKRGFWFIPTQTTLYSWLRRVGFRDIITLYGEALAPSEQAATVLAPGASLSAGLTLSDGKNLTIEGYPPPLRYYVVASK